MWWWKQIKARAKITCQSPLGFNLTGVQSISSYFVTVVERHGLYGGYFEQILDIQKWLVAGASEV